MMEKKNKRCSLAEKEKLAKLYIKHKKEYDIEEYEVMIDLEIDKDENIFEIFLLQIYKSVCVTVVYLLYTFSLSISI